MLWHLNVLVGAIIVLIDCLQPTGIIMCMRHNMHVESVFVPASQSGQCRNILGGIVKLVHSYVISKGWFLYYRISGKLASSLPG